MQALLINLSEVSSVGEGRIAFRSTRNDAWDIYAVNPDGSNLANLSSHPGRDWDFAWSPDGGRLAFISSRNDRDPQGCNMWCTTEIYTINADGSELTRLTEVSAMHRNPVWSPDGTRIAFVSSRDSGDSSGCPFNCNFEIYTMNADGRDQIRLTSSPGADHLPSWSPDGKRIAFTSDRDGNFEIYVINSDGSGLARLTEDAGADLRPFWSPDGKKIAFISNRNYPDPACILAECQYDIFVIRVDEDQSETLAASEPIQIHRTNSFFLDFFSVSWSPDSSQLLSHVINDGNYDIYIANVENDELVYLTDTPANDLAPVWSPDGKRIAFTSDRDGNVEIYIMDVPDGNITRLTNDPANDFLPMWSSP